LAAFFASVGQPAVDGPFDPWLVFDPYINRFWLVAVSMNNAAQRSTLLVALSNSSDATAGWTLFSLDARLNGNRNSNFWCDYPKVGIDAQAVIFTCNMFSFGTPRFQYAKIRIMTKDQFISGTCCRWWDVWDLRDIELPGGIPTPVAPRSFTVQPAVMHDASVTDGMFLVNAEGRGARGNELIVRRVRNAGVCCVPGNQRRPTIELRSILVGSFSPPPDASQPGTTTRLDTGDTRLLYAFWKRGLLSVGQNLACRGVACIGFTELNVAAYPQIRVVSDFAESAPPLHLYYPHVAVNANGDRTMVFSASGSALFAQARYVGIPPSSICTNCLDGPHVTIASGQNRHVRINPLDPRK
jgi:hypothetical protein